MTSKQDRLDAMRRLSPLRNSTDAGTAKELVQEQLLHFGLDPKGEYAKTLGSVAEHLYESHADVDALWKLTLETIHSLDPSDRIAYFNAKKFLSFQLAKILDTLQNAFRRSYQALGYRYSSLTTKGPYPVFDNVAAIFSATPVITRTATYIYACAEWIEDAFNGKELMLEIYSRLLNPTSICLANFIVDIETGPYAREYLAWNFNSGMAAIDGVLSHVLGRDDMIIRNRSIYGGAHQLIEDWYGKRSNLAIDSAVFNGYDLESFETCWAQTKEKWQPKLDAGRKAYVYLESPCNPHGYVLDVPAICKRAHELGMRVILDATVGTPFLVRPLQRKDPAERPDFVIHSYTKDLTGTGSVIAGVVLGRNEDMFIPKGESFAGVDWSDTLFWNVYYVKGAFLNADAAYEVITGMRTLPLRMLAKCINTRILAAVLERHPQIKVQCHSLESSPNAELRERLLFLGLPAPLFTFDVVGVPPEAFKRFFDCLAPTFSHMISLGQCNTIISCPAFTTHSELDEEALRDSDLGPTTIRCAVGDEDVNDLLAHFIHTARLTIDSEIPGFSDGFGDPKTIDAMVQDIYTKTHRQFIASKAPLADKLAADTPLD